MSTHELEMWHISENDKEDMKESLNHLHSGHPGWFWLEQWEKMHLLGHFGNNLGKLAVSQSIQLKFLLQI